MFYGKIMIIVIEGVDGAGKTTIARLLENELDATVVSASLEDFNPAVRAYVDKNPQDTMAHFKYYLEANIRVIDRVQKLCKEDHNVIVVFDRSIYSVIATNVALDRVYNKGKNITVMENIGFEIWENAPRPDLFILLRVDELVRGLRMQLRDKKNDELDNNIAFVEQTEDAFRKISARLSSKGLPILEIDTTNISEKEVIEKIIGRINPIRSPQIIKQGRCR